MRGGPIKLAGGRALGLSVDAAKPVLRKWKRRSVQRFGFVSEMAIHGRMDFRRPLREKSLGKVFDYGVGTMKRKAAEYSTQELTKDSLPDFEKLLGKRPAPGAYMCWCLYHHRAGSPTAGKHRQSRVKRAASNREEKRELVENGRSHGILVFSHGEPVGWCQYGSAEELPRIDTYPGYRKLAGERERDKLWRITCFVVVRTHRRRGVASIALEAALDAIRKKGGGLVEAYPIVRWGSYREYLGTVSMFQKAGFKIVAPFGKNNVVMRKGI